MQAPNYRYAGAVLADWGDVAVWKRGFLDAAAAQGLREYYTVKDHAIDPTISPTRRAEIHAAAEIAVAPVAHDLSSKAFGKALLARTHAIIAYVAHAVTTEEAAARVRPIAAVDFLLSALSPHLHNELGDYKSPYALWTKIHDKGYVLMDDCRLFGLLEHVRFADDDELPHALARVEEHIQRFVNVIFVPSHGSDARLVAAADRLKMALLCNACPLEMARVFEAWRADEPVWDYASMRRRLVEQCHHHASSKRRKHKSPPPSSSPVELKGEVVRAHLPSQLQAGAKPAAVAPTGDGHSSSRTTPSAAKKQLEPIVRQREIFQLGQAQGLFINKPPKHIRSELNRLRLMRKAAAEVQT
ncbi:hypothetical protein SDRG_16208 [Saprolegnia diclina VS20]|uniref:Uncharacterized protein n=1 Tax=Saprolegnia diclina (strain VS20) TaxID=1156394 RepID=T0PUS3_SAPDV|nr:hypothetical protein SDRG_16208 [Saprolegnia diclina VS20]EQC25951.1 hypothetical protein SDRG_16208 [Saprolegnia diclina VS20]|eukprot:XP_008620631.1 hypothetical protein SDRG_16208 [Saprolegnia diclina VS20]